MNFILDTHTFIWFINGEKLPATVVRKIEDINNKCFISVASIWEIAIKSSLGKLTLNAGFDNVNDALHDNNIEILPITFEHMQQLVKLLHHHNDPFDRLIIAQSMTEKLVVISTDSKFKLHDVDVQWN